MATKEEIKSKFEEWLDAQPEETKTLIQDRFSALESTVKATRTERDDLNKSLKELGKKVEIDSEAGKQLIELRSKLESSEKKANFLELATKQGIKKPSIAYALALQENMFLEDGNPDFAKIKESLPEIFSVQTTNTNAGSGTNQKIQSANVNPIKTYLEKRHGNKEIK